MVKHEKALMREVRVDNPNPNYAAMMLEQLGGGNGELKAALTEPNKLSVKKKTVLAGDCPR